MQLTNGTTTKKAAWTTCAGASSISAKNRANMPTNHSEADLMEAFSEVKVPAFASENRFRINLDPKVCASMLAGFYAAEVRKRGGSEVWTDEVKKAIVKMAVNLTNPQKNGFILLGPTGTGKTTFIKALQKLIIHLGDRGHFEFMRDPRYCTTPRPQLRLADVREVLDEVADSRTKWREGVAGVDMLAIDDLGKEQVQVMDYGTAKSPVIDLLEHRYNRMLFTFITSNLDPKEIRPRYGDRVADRLNEMCVTIIFNDESFRKNFASTKKQTQS